MGLPAVCEAHSKLQSMSFLGGLGMLPHAENFEKCTDALRLNLVLSEEQNCYPKDRLWKSAVREISLAASACYTFAFLKLSI